MHGRKYEHATVLEDLQGGVKLDVTGGPVGIEYDMEKWMLSIMRFSSKAIKS